MIATKEDLIEAIRAIYTAPIYAEQKRENGISVELIAAVSAAAELAGLSKPMAGLPPHLVEMERLLATLNARGIYPKLEGKVLSEWLPELRALVAIERKDSP